MHRDRHDAVGCARSTAVVVWAANCDDVVVKFGTVTKGSRYRGAFDTKSCFAYDDNGAYGAMVRLCFWCM